jgi:hypothetical protein
MNIINTNVINRLRNIINTNIIIYLTNIINHLDGGLCGLAVTVPGYKSRGPGSIPGATRFSEK